MLALPPPAVCMLLQPIGQAQGRGIFLFNKLSQVSWARRCLRAAMQSTGAI